MLGLTRQIAQRGFLMPAASTQICSRRNKTVPIYTIAPIPPVTNRTMGPWPATKEEREKAAKKYNLIYEDYEPFPEDEGFGDYPMLPAVGAFNRYKYDDFDDPSDMRFYGEPFHINASQYYWEREDPMEDEKIYYQQYPPWMRFLMLCSVVAGFIAVFKGLIYFRININHPWKIRSYNEGRPLYAFPVSESDHNHSHH